MASNKTIEPLKTLLQECLGYEPDKLVSRTEWGSINFQAAKADLDRIFAITGHLNLLPLEYLTDQAVNQIKQALDGVKGVLDRLDAFDLASGTPTQIRDQIVNEIHTQADNFYTIATPWIPFLAYQKGDVAENISTLTESVREAQGLVGEAKKDITKKKGEIEGIVTAAREASASAGAAVFTQDFDEEAGKLKTGANKWLKITAGMAIATILFALALWFVSEPTDDPLEAAQKFGARIAVLVVLFTATVWCGRNYKALMHQSTNNRHRALSLQTFQAFSSAASDDATRNAVLLETTRSIFSNSSTGYVESPQSNESPVQIIEVAKVVREEADSAT